MKDINQSRFLPRSELRFGCLHKVHLEPWNIANPPSRTQLSKLNLIGIGMRKEGDGIMAIFL